MRFWFLSALLRNQLINARWQFRPGKLPRLQWYTQSSMTFIILRLHYAYHVLLTSLCRLWLHIATGCFSRLEYAITSAMPTSLLAGFTHITHQFVRESQSANQPYITTQDRDQGITTQQAGLPSSIPRDQEPPQIVTESLSYVLHPNTCHELLVSNSLQTQPALGNDNPVNPNGHLSEHTFLSCDWVSICDWWQTSSRAWFQEPFWYSASRRYRPNAAPHPNFPPQAISSISFIWVATSSGR